MTKVMGIFRELRELARQEKFIFDTLYISDDFRDG